MPGLHEHHLFVFVPRSVGSVGAGDAPRPRGGWLDTPACPTAPATVLHNGGGTLLRPFAAALGSPQTLTTWSRPSRCHTIALYISFLSFALSFSFSLSFLPPFPLFFHSSLYLRHLFTSFTAVSFTKYIYRLDQSPREGLFLCRGKKHRRSGLENIETTSKQPWRDGILSLSSAATVIVFFFFFFFFLFLYSTWRFGFKRNSLNLPSSEDAFEYVVSRFSPARARLFRSHTKNSSYLHARSRITLFPLSFLFIYLYIYLYKYVCISCVSLVLFFSFYNIYIHIYVYIVYIFILHVSLSLFLSRFD